MWRYTLLALVFRAVIATENFLDEGPVSEDHGPIVAEVNTVHTLRDWTSLTTYPRSCIDISHRSSSNLATGMYTIYDPEKFQMSLHGFHPKPVRIHCDMGDHIRQRRAIVPTLETAQPQSEPTHPRDCADIYMHHRSQGRVSPSGIYKIYSPKWYRVAPDGIVFLPIYVYCDMVTSGGGWTVFQRRQDGSVDFYRKWYEYEQGFGRISGEYWLGLRIIHLLTELRKTSLHIIMVDKLERETYAAYNGFGVGNSTSGYVLGLGCYSGNDHKGDKLTRHKGKKFTTLDRDQDNHGPGKNCAVERHGGYWYDSCTDSNLNGDYNATSGWSRVYWGSGEENYIKSYVTMAFRPEHYQ